LTTVASGALPYTTAMNTATTNGISEDPPGSENVRKNGVDRLKSLEALFLEGPVNAQESKCFSTETLLDVLMVLFNECCNSSLRKEKTVTEFIDLGKFQKFKTILIYFSYHE
jgi:hypothetical protein